MRNGRESEWECLFSTKHPRTIHCRGLDGFGHMAGTRAHGGGRRQGAPGLDRWKDRTHPHRRAVWGWRGARKILKAPFGEVHHYRLE